MSRVLVYTTSGDDALATARVIAEWTTGRLADEGHEVRVLPRTDRGSLEGALPGVEGLAAFAHGRHDALLDEARSAVLDRRNIGLLADRWAWLYACRTAHELAALAMEAGASCFAGFDVAVHVDWTPADLPTDLRPTFERLVTEVPSRLAAGEHDADVIRGSLLPLVDLILDYCIDQPAAPAGIEIAAQQMLRRLVISSGSTHPSPTGLPE